jgi:hypothetical protein
MPRIVELSDLYGYVNACRQIELFELINRLGGWFDYVEQPFVCSGLKLFHRFLVDVRTAINGIFLYPRGQGNRPDNSCACSLRRFNYIGHSLIKYYVIKPFQPYSDTITVHGVPTDLATA